MPSSHRVMLSCALIAALATPAWAQSKPDPATVVARVNGEEITLGHMIVAHANLPEQYRNLPLDVLYDGLLDQLIQQTALKQSHQDDTPAFVDLSLDNERRSLLAGEAVRQIVENAASDAEVRAAYDAKYGEGFGSEEYDASHILVETEEEAKEVIRMLDEGAEFAAVAKEKSTGPSGPNGGSLGWFGPGMMVAPFEEAVVAMEPGAVSQPVQTQFGWHVIRLNDKRNATAPAFEDVAGELRETLRQEAVTGIVNSLVASGEIEKPATNIPPDAIRNLDLVRQ